MREGPWTKNVRRPKAKIATVQRIAGRNLNASASLGNRERGARSSQTCVYIRMGVL